jgi:hypothetical protein
MSIEDKQARSVFGESLGTTETCLDLIILFLVGNIPHGTTEEQMKDYFSDVGTVLSFRCV